MFTGRIIAELFPLSLSLYFSACVHLVLVQRHGLPRPPVETTHLHCTDTPSRLQDNKERPSLEEEMKVTDFKMNRTFSTWRDGYD